MFDVGSKKSKCFYDCNTLFIGLIIVFTVFYVKTICKGYQNSSEMLLHEMRNKKFRDKEGTSVTNAKTDTQKKSLKEY